MGDASGNKIPPVDFFGQGKKRSRTEPEQENYITPTQSNSDFTSDDNTSTSVSGTSLPMLQLNGDDLNIQGNASIETVVTPSEMNGHKEKLAFKLDKLNDKRCRYESHEAFLKKCIDNHLVPAGLRVFVEPSIGNRDDAFLHKWHERLNDFSKTLTLDVIEYCEAEIARTKEAITETSERLKALVTTPVYTDINNTIATNEKSRTNELIQRKNRKFYKLKYGDRETERRQERPPADPRVIYSNKGHRGMRRNPDSSDEDRRIRGNKNYNDIHDGRNPNTRKDRGEDRREDRPVDHQKDRRNEQNQHNERVIAAIDRRNERRNYADAVRNNTPRENGSGRGPTINRREDVPLHERIALSRRNSNRSMDPRRRDDEPRQLSNPNQNERLLDEKDREIRILRRRLESREQNNDNLETVTSHYSREETTLPKNGNGAQLGPSAVNLDEMRRFLKEAMGTINAFAKQLNVPTGTEPTHSDK